MQTIPLEPVDEISITTLMDNVMDILLPDEEVAKRTGGISGKLLTTPAGLAQEGESYDALQAEHGFSALVRTRKGGREHSFLFDAGVTTNGVCENMRRLELSPRDLEAIVFSHGHFDHTMGLHGLVRELGRWNVPVILHPDFWTKRRLAIPGREPLEMPTTSKNALLEVGFEVIEDRRPSFLFEGAVLVTGEVDRTTEFEKGFPIHEALRDGDWQPDPLILDDQAMLANVRGRGLVVLTGCGHAGIVNILRYAQRLTGIDKLYAVVGGFHLTGRYFEPLIPLVIEALRALNPEVVVPAHCTGWKAVHQIAAALPDAFIQNSVGTRFELKAA